MTKFSGGFYLLYLINIAIATPYIYMASYKGIIQRTIWQKVSAKEKDSLERQIHEVEEREKNNNRPQYQKPGLNESRTNEIIARLTYVLDREKLYQLPELTLQELADKLDYPSYQVSFTINEGLKKSFYDLINGYRVEEAKRLLTDEKSKNFTILSVGFEAGFNSKTTFNTVFKKFTGQTPTEYRATQMQQAFTA
jgi:AraC-like DNA-binding protein